MDLIHQFLTIGKERYLREVTPKVDDSGLPYHYDPTYIDKDIYRISPNKAKESINLDLRSSRHQEMIPVRGTVEPIVESITHDHLLLSDERKFIREKGLELEGNTNSIRNSSGFKNFLKDDPIFYNSYYEERDGKEDQTFGIFGLKIKII